MSYRSGGYKSPLAGAGAVVGILFGIFVVLRMLGLIAGGLSGLGGPNTPEGVERALFRDAETGPIYRTLKRTYPQEYDVLVADVVRRAKAGQPHEQIEEAILTDLIEAGRRHRKDMIQAPHQSFAAYRRDEIKVLQTLKDADTDLCATYVIKGAVRSHSLGVASGPLIAFRIAGLEAGAAGRDHPVNRPVARPDPADVQRLGRQMQMNGASQPMVAAFFSNAGLDQASPQDQCATGLAFYRAMDQMPGDKGDQFYAYLIASAPLSAQPRRLYRPAALP